MRHLGLVLSVLFLAGIPLSLIAQDAEQSEPSDRVSQSDETDETRGEEEGNAESHRIFKTRDRHGNVMFTDDPKGGGEEVRVGPSNTLPMSVPERARQVPDNLKNREQKTLDYKISIESPSEEQTFQNPGGPIPVKVTVSPEPAEGHRLVIKYDGVALDKPEIPWPQNRGTHTVSASIVDEDGNVIEAAPPRTLYIHKASKLLPPNN